ncbi:MAG: nuclear transport factor 2 family protein [Halieaceae bacterium]|nr:nuclear transport factor 2 family protein [Halieaceae bacterium]
MSKTEIFRKYWDAVATSDQEAIQALVTDDMSIVGPLTRNDGKQQFLEGVKPVMKFSHGYTLHRQFEHGEELVSIYEIHVGPPATPGDVLVAEWMRFRDGKVASTRMIFNGADLAKLLPEGLRPTRSPDAAP